MMLQSANKAREINPWGGPQMNQRVGTIFVCSDSVGETAETVVRATMRQFDARNFNIKRWANIKTEEEIRHMMEEAARIGSFVVYTLVLPELREVIQQESARLRVYAVDVMGPVMEAFVNTFNSSPKQMPGRFPMMDPEYFKRVEAIEFSVRCDDGQYTSAWDQADLILLGVSRTTKTPLSIYLAHKGYKVANYPLVPEVKVPDIIFDLPGSKFIGLTMKAETLAQIRSQRLKTMGLPYHVAYASFERVTEELEYAHNLFRQLGCRVLDVTDRAIEETAGTILETLAQKPEENH
jgi:hypothetical protein